MLATESSTPASGPFHVLTINTGSSSLKFALYEIAEAESLLFAGQIGRIGLGGCRFTAEDGRGDLLADEHVDLPDHGAAVDELLAWLADRPGSRELDAVGHRIVHGGPHYRKPQRITPNLLSTLSDLVPLDPDHLPQEIKTIRAVSRAFSELPQVACFDTAFHRHMPELAQTVPLPSHLRCEGIIRYGFHGLSYEYVIGELRKEAGDEAADGRVIVAHLGSGASMAAVRNGRSVDTTMGMTPAGGLMMSTRSGDLDPGVLLYLLQEKGMRPASVNDLVNHHAGLLAVSGTSSDMQDLLTSQKADPDAAAAVELFCYLAKKSLGALAAVLGGLDTLVFTGGIGENAPLIRERIVDDLDFLGIRLDTARNGASAAVISRDQSQVTVRVMQTNEELMIVRHVYQLLAGQEARAE